MKKVILSIWLLLFAQSTFATPVISSIPSSKTYTCMDYFGVYGSIRNLRPIFTSDASLTRFMTHAEHYFCALARRDQERARRFAPAAESFLGDKASKKAIDLLILNIDKEAYAIRAEAHIASMKYEIAQGSIDLSK